MAKRGLSVATIAAQAGGYIDAASGGVVPPIQPSTTFARDRSYQPHPTGNIYARDDNDVGRIAEALLAQLDNAETALLFPNGMAAIAAVFRALPGGATVLVQSQIYWGTTKWLREFCARRSVTLIEADLSDIGQAQSLCAQHQPDLVFIETPSNPWLRTTDIALVAEATHAAGGRLVVDATAATPILTRALDFGADIVMHSATKGINGHSDVLAGVLATNAPADSHWQAIAIDRHDAGAVIGSFEAWLLIRSIRTLPLRVERMSQNAQAVAEFLQSHDAVAQVFYPGLPDFDGHSVAKRQMAGGFGSLLSFCVKGGAVEALRVAGQLNLFHRATSLGGVESLVEHRHTIEPHTGIPESLLRLSIGIEDVQDLCADLEQALTC
ncbi:PLP-dependent aspartate aminotransferase family protein [Planktomarina temperata]|jgi:cystathionine gamma-synthase|uniref:PLP-dependent aspartate aminotransferase family protein n=2 Tax=Paracoccaceae TaxID=31989 RepID=UPI002303A333|nr:PLP-dependent transferase [Planktomarina temperata]MDA9345376.1 PLP-dependent aspartate aminotransferase family protein [bacterium]MDA7461542.1 PLP-dependent aspartate aminotransferase family protein [Planktomarina temperata]MDA7467668.1 PLP-dependent aspartate aminotransferase family protein [Planktomarina temperata]MDA7474728.1 PLP-dependent aspartate aminotransferase family protein [Planktomarina temperata]